MEQRDQIIKLLKEKSVMKQDVYRNTQNVFDMFGDLIKEISHDLQKEIGGVDNRVTVNFTMKTDHEIELKVAGDVLVFYMHTNVFEFDKSHPMYKTSYIKNNEYNSYSGIIYIYNFLSDSFKYNRLADLGYLIGRIFINREKKFFMEAKPPIGYKYSTFSPEPLHKDTLKEILYDLIIYAVSFDLFTPPFEVVKEISVNEIVERVNSDSLRTGKRLGYRLSAEKEDDDFSL
ncbi:MAG: hypothetical protein IAF38_10720 [Bacteroidia bacterium]|nr:hypothetical protein [Bacteroidia bacterium]